MTDTFEDARRARLAGRYSTAELILRQILDKNPIDALAAGLLGQCLAETGEAPAARKFIDLALSIAPNNADIRLNAAALREYEGDLRAAIEEAHLAAQLDGSKFEIWATLGKLYGIAGAYKDAAAALTRACRINPRHSGAAMLLVGACFETEDFAGARRALDLVDAASHNLPDAMKMRAHLARRTSDWNGLVEIGTRWVKATNSDESRVALAYGLSQLGYHDQAAEAYAPIAERNPPNAEHLAAMGRYKLSARRIDEARQWFDRALKADSHCAEAAFGLSRLLTFTGDLAQAETMARRALAISPRHAEAYGQLGEITGSKFTDAEFAELKSLCADASLDPYLSATAHFAYADALHRKKDHAGAFASWSKANALKVEEFAKSPGGAYNPAAQEQKVRRIMELFPRDAATAAPASDIVDFTPIFIIGMPRSGTTLLESAISAHPMVASGGELPTLPFILDEFLAWADRPGRSVASIPGEMRDDWRARYFRQRDSLALGPAEIITDKQPPNFHSVGFIRRIFPEAKIIHIRRNPLETGFSIFRRHFSKQWPYASDLRSIGHYYGQYARLMAHWERQFPGAFAFVQYENLVENFEAEIRRLVAFCDLGWNDRCLDFSNAERSVITFSAVQVRKGASKDHLGSTVPYAEYLKPLRDALVEAGVDLSTGAAPTFH